MGAKKKKKQELQAHEVANPLLALPATEWGVRRKLRAENPFCSAKWRYSVQKRYRGHQPGGISARTGLEAGATAKDLNERELQEQALAEAIRRLEQEKLTLNDTEPYRLVVAYRITRALARLRNQFSLDTPLTEIDFGLWRDPCLATASNHSTKSSVITAELQLAKDSGGFSLQPPKPPVDEDGYIDESYDPNEDERLLCWIRLVSAISEVLLIPLGSKKQPDMGKLGLVGLVNPALVHMCWPSPYALIRWEQALVEATLDLVIDKSILAARRRLKDMHGFTNKEATAVLAMANGTASEWGEMNVEDAKAMHTLRLESYIRRSKEAMDLNSEIKGLKQLSLVQGINRAEPEDMNTSFTEVAKKIQFEEESALEAEWEDAEED